jgi:glycogen operon protein
MVLYRPDGQQMSDEDWRDPAAKTLAVALDGRNIEDDEGATNRERLLLLLNAYYEPVEFVVPRGRAIFQVVLTSTDPVATPAISGEGKVTLDGRSLLLLRSEQ